jgi:hypothetical protein
MAWFLTQWQGEGYYYEKHYNAPLSDVYHNSENKNLKTFYVILARRTIL